MSRGIEPVRGFCVKQTSQWLVCSKNVRALARGPRGFALANTRDPLGSTNPQTEAYRLLSEDSYV